MAERKKIDEDDQYFEKEGHSLATVKSAEKVSLLPEEKEIVLDHPADLPQHSEESLRGAYEEMCRTEKLDFPGWLELDEPTRDFYRAAARKERAGEPTNGNVFCRYLD